jgi:hypothetical protein
MIESTGFTNGSAATANDFVDAPPAAANGFTNGAGAPAGADAGETELEPIAVIGMGECFSLSLSSSAAMSARM